MKKIFITLLQIIVAWGAINMIAIILGSMTDSPRLVGVTLFLSTILVPIIIIWRRHFVKKDVIVATQNIKNNTNDVLKDTSPIQIPTNSIKNKKTGPIMIVGLIIALFIVVPLVIPPLKDISNVKNDTLNINEVTLNINETTRTPMKIQESSSDTADLYSVNNRIFLWSVKDSQSKFYEIKNDTKNIISGLPSQVYGFDVNETKEGVVFTLTEFKDGSIQFYLLNGQEAQQLTSDLPAELFVDDTYGAKNKWVGINSKTKKIYVSPDGVNISEVQGIDLSEKDAKLYSISRSNNTISDVYLSQVEAYGEPCLKNVYQFNFLTNKFDLILQNVCQIGSNNKEVWTLTRDDNFWFVNSFNGPQIIARAKVPREANINPLFEFVGEQTILKGINKYLITDDSYIPFTTERNNENRKYHFTEDCLFELETDRGTVIYCVEGNGITKSDIYKYLILDGEIEEKLLATIDGDVEPRNVIKSVYDGYYYFEVLFDMLPSNFYRIDGDEVQSVSRSVAYKLFTDGVDWHDESQFIIQERDQINIYTVPGVTFFHTPYDQRQVFVENDFGYYFRGLKDGSVEGIYYVKK